MPVQCVAFFGTDSSVVTITRSTCSSRIVRGAPDRGASMSPSTPSAAKRRRHLLTVMSQIPSRAPTSRFVIPGSAQARTMRDRNASACSLGLVSPDYSEGLCENPEDSRIARGYG